MEAAEEPSSGLKREIKTEDLDAEEGDAWLAASCFEEEEEGEDKVKMEVEESVKMEVEEEEAKDSVERPKKLEELRSCKVVLRDCIRTHPWKKTFLWHGSKVAPAKRIHHGT